MNNIIRKITIVSALLIVLASGEAANANTLVYNRRVNRSISITPEANAVGYSYSVVDTNGNVVLSGKITDLKTFSITTQKLKKGAYEFRVGSSTVQTFIIK